MIYVWGIAVLCIVILGFIYTYMFSMPGTSHHGSLPEATSEEHVLAQELTQHVEMLATEIGDRNLLYRPQQLEAAASYIEKYWQQLGYDVQSHEFKAHRKHSCRNLEVEIAGAKKEVVIVGAHYDSLPGVPAANDNGSAVAAMLALSKICCGMEFEKTLRFVAFVNEEPPFFFTHDMGSWQYAQRCRQRKENIVAMLCLETIGYYSDQPGSQKYPFPFNFFYPSIGNFIAFVGNLQSRSLVRSCMRSFRNSISFPSEGGAFPGSIPGINWSDHWSFWQHDYPAVMITDTALFRYPYYHTPQDTAEKIDYQRTARVVAGVQHIIKELVGASQ